MLDLILKVLQIFSALATVAGVIGLFLTIKTYKEGKIIQSKSEDRRIILTSIQVLEIFSNRIIPDMGKYEKEVYEEIPKNKQKAVDAINKASEESGLANIITVEDLPSELVDQIVLATKMESNLLKTFNSLEHVSVYINYELVDDSLIYNAVHNVFCNFIERNKDVFYHLITDEVPFINIRKLYDNWKK
ncbi:unnamed protein product [Fructobacillus tropaeoli]|uniref:hypothetical protein n=1 Tax=Fructobacillus tropaeoli TaxID=709323 RepID=UPI002DB4B342|nr:unnamed protein product [Fructobacillus tropaeoli]